MSEELKKETVEEVSKPVVNTESIEQPAQEEKILTEESKKETVEEVSKPVVNTESKEQPAAEEENKISS